MDRRSAARLLLDCIEGCENSGTETCEETRVKILDVLKENDMFNNTVFITELMKNRADHSDDYEYTWHT